MPRDSENSMTNVEQAEKFWQQLLTAPSLTENDRTLAEQNSELLLLAFSRSAFLAETLIQKPSFLSRVISPLVQYTNKQHDTLSKDQQQEREVGADVIENKIKAEYQSALNDKLDNTSTEDALFKALREYRNLEMARITFFDILNKQPIETSLLRVSALADVLINGAYHWIYHHLSVRYGKPQSNDHDMHMYILGMGKLGGRELNFSSDIDLIFAYPEKGETQGGRKNIENQQFFTKVAQKLIQALNKVTNDGQVSR